MIAFCGECFKPRLILDRETPCPWCGHIRLKASVPVEGKIETCRTFSLPERPTLGTEVIYRKRPFLVVASISRPATGLRDSFAIPWVGDGEQNWDRLHILHWSEEERSTEPAVTQVSSARPHPLE